MDNDTIVSTTFSGFQFSGVPTQGNTSLDDTEYCIAEVIVDDSGSISSFARDIEKYGLQQIVELCKKLPTASKIMLRVSKFSSCLPNGVEEIHGLKLIRNCDSNNYNNILKANGGTPLFDATAYCLETAETYGKSLYDQEYDCSAVVFIITDGDENDSRKFTSAKKIKELIERIRTSETSLTSITTVLIGVNVKDITIKNKLEAFKNEANLNSFVALEDATVSSIGKIANLISQSLSSASQNITSKNIVINPTTLTI